jgi:hypothetical protein
MDAINILALYIISTEKHVDTSSGRVFSVGLAVFFLLTTETLRCFTSVSMGPSLQSLRACMV